MEAKNGKTEPEREFMTAAADPALDRGVEVGETDAANAKAALPAGANKRFRGDLVAAGESSFHARVDEADEESYGGEDEQ